MKKLLILLGLVLCIHIPICAQIKIDFKTEFLDKTKPMQAVKAGIIGFFKENTAWIQVVSTFEKYSVWIKDLKVVPKEGNPLISVVSYKLELRTPAMIRDGKFIDAVTIKYESNTQEPLPFENVPELERSLQAINKKLEKTETGSSIALVLAVLTPTGMARTASKVGSLFQSEYTPAQKNMGVLAGYYATAYLYDMLKKNNAFN